ncbi:hypothetical protein AK812_SmicGene3533 [Symbiodinium microadriaticum]|uniref:Uncharacterized protein n=1 Tax=Symbiodinium microadriaticum TaxID=2951 RepID=A0A1Q9EYY4_SYMMI|nr:hypothetical protein AK812_SmicGene3533 [Symbiodinium microadriaticum]
MDEAPQDGVVHQDLPPAYNQGAAAPQAPTKPGPARSAKHLGPVNALDAAEEEEMPVALASRKPSKLQSPRAQAPKEAPTTPSPKPGSLVSGEAASATPGTASSEKAKLVETLERELELVELEEGQRTALEELEMELRCLEEHVDVFWLAGKQEMEDTTASLSGVRAAVAELSEELRTDEVRQAMRTKQSISAVQARPEDEEELAYLPISAVARSLQLGTRGTSAWSQRLAATVEVQLLQEASELQRMLQEERRYRCRRYDHLMRASQDLLAELSPRNTKAEAAAVALTSDEVLAASPRSMGSCSSTQTVLPAEMKGIRRAVDTC